MLKKFMTWYLFQKPKEKQPKTLENICNIMVGLETMCLVFIYLLTCNMFITCVLFGGMLYFTYHLDKTSNILREYLKNDKYHDYANKLYNT